jgi:hypothetical protein
MAQTPQTYKNHTRWFPPYHFFVMPVLLINFLNSIRHLYKEPTLHETWELIVAAALLMLGLLARVMVVAVQDRVIRLEVRLRLHELLPPDLRARIGELTRQQCVALRFAGDAEMPELVRQILAGTLTKQKDIKLKVKDWQGDYLRA